MHLPTATIRTQVMLPLRFATDSARPPRTKQPSWLARSHPSRSGSRPGCTSTAHYLATKAGMGAPAGAPVRWPALRRGVGHGTPVDLW